MGTKFTKSTDEKHKIKIESSIVSARWTGIEAHAGGNVGFEVRTLFVGEGGKISVTGKSEKGKKLDKVKGKIYANCFTGKINIPEKVKPGDMAYFEVKLSQLGLSDKSDRIPIKPKIEVSNMKWDKQEARRGDFLKLTADIEGIGNGAEVKVIIFEYDQDGNHDKVIELPAIVRNKKIEVTWEYDYHDSTLNIATEQELQKYDKEKHYAHPEFYFTLRVDDEEYGTKQESGLLKFKDILDFRLLKDNGEPYANEDYIILLADGKDQKGTLDENGHGFAQDLPPGKVTIILPKKGLVFGK